MKCQLCNQDVNGTRGLASHIRFNHDDVEYQDYIKTYVDTVPGYDSCDVCGKVTRNRGSTTFVTCSRKCSATWKRENWTGEDAPRHGKSHSQETKDKIGKKAKERLSDPENHPMYGKHHSDETKRKISESHRLLYENGYENPMKGANRKAETLKKTFQHRSMSDVEMMFKDILDNLNIAYQAQYYLSVDGVTRVYDFKVENVLIEVDGDYWHGGPGANTYYDKVEQNKKNDRFKDQFAKENEYDIIRFWGSEVKDNSEKIKQSLTNLKTTNKLK